MIGMNFPNYSPEEENADLRAEIDRLNKIIGVYGRADRVKTEEIQRLQDALSRIASRDSAVFESKDIAREALDHIADVNKMVKP